MPIFQLYEFFNFPKTINQEQIINQDFSDYVEDHSIGNSVQRVLNSLDAMRWFLFIYFISMRTICFTRRYVLVLTNQRIPKLCVILTSITQLILSCPAHSQFLINYKTKHITKHITLTYYQTKLTFLSLTNLVFWT